MNDHLPEDLKSMRLHYLKQNLDDFVAAMTKSRFGPREMIEEIVRRELLDRKTRSTESRLKAAHLPRYRPMADFDWDWPKKIDRTGFERIFGLEFISAKENVIIPGPSGCGKSMIACNLVHNAVMAGYTSAFVTASSLVLDLGQQESARALQSRIRKYVNPNLLIIDELGYLSFDARASDLLFQIISQRYERGSIVLTTNLAFKDWPTVFPNSACITAMIDRLTHHASVLPIEADSYRNRESKETQKIRTELERKKTK